MAPTPSSSRRTVLKSLGAAAALSAVGGRVAADGHDGDDSPTVEELLSVPDELVPENIGFDAEGNLYFGITAGQLRRLPADLTDETGLTLDDADLVTDELPGAAGVEVGPNGDEGEDGGPVYVAGGSSGLVFAVTPDGDVTELARLVEQGSGFVNDVVVDADHDRLLVTESFAGTVYEVPLDDGDDEADGDGGASVFVQSPLLDTATFGANGPAIGPGGDLFVAVTRVGEQDAGGTGRIVRVPVCRKDGHAGDPSVYVEDEELFGADGLTARGEELYVAVNSQNKVTRVTADRELETVVEGDPLVFPSEAVFGTKPGQRCDLFVCNFANQTPEAAGILRVPGVGKDDDYGGDESEAGGPSGGGDDSDDGDDGADAYSDE
ncbi:SMP-30/gluconolactonase/LRE family protein [Halobium salinum]|uniref:SMP-30/gluconolactonase/LRE family protein n=1 Tax=Halobium salinum TaxID=1364940 RepID=A0ABD5PFN1_9EURY|nr:hypothetical protein [Halobium salinum]